MMSPSIQLQPLKIHYRLTDSWQRPEFMGSRLRGMFGHSLRQQVCTEHLPNCGLCPKLKRCAYPQVFESLPNGTQRMPPAFVLKPPPMGEQQLHAGDLITFGQILFAPAIPWLTDTLLAWECAHFEENTAGIELKNIELTDLNNKVLQEWQPGHPMPTALPQQTHIPIHESNHVTIELITPLRLREKGKDIKPNQLKAHHIVMSAMRRLRLIAPSVADNSLLAKLPAPVMHSWAQSLQMDADIRWVDLQRWSNRQQKEVPISGITGIITLRGNLQPYLPALHLLPLIGLGKHCNFGLGQVRIIAN